MEVYWPGRLFIYNFCKYCNYNSIEDLLNDINDIIIDDIKNEIDEFESITRLSQQDGKNSILTCGFKKYIENINSDDKKRAPEYCLLNCYLKIKELNEHIKKWIENKNLSFIEVSTIDKKSFDVFKDYVELAESELYGITSLRNLQRILQPDGGPYNKKPTNLIKYVISKFFPNALVKRKVEFSYICENWQRALFYIEDNGEQKIYIHGDSQSVENIEKSLKNKFIALNDIDKNRDENVYDEVGKSLWDIYTSVIDLFNKQQISNIPNDFSTSEISQNQNMLVQNEGLNNRYDVYLSSHILGFMRWLPLISENQSDFKLMESIENVIDKIRDTIFNNYGNIVSEENLKKCKAGMLFVYGSKKTNSVIDVNNDELRSLRKILIEALYGEDYIHSKFCEYYM